MSYQSWFTDQPERQWRSGLGAEGGSWRIKQTPLQEEDSDPRYDTFQRAWKNGASLSELFGNSAYALHGSVGPSGADNHRPDVTKVQAFLEKTGHLALPEWGPSGWYNQDTHDAIGDFQRKAGLEQDHVILPAGPTLSAIKSRLTTTNSGIDEESKPGWDILKPAPPNPPIRVPTPDGSPLPPPKPPIFGPWPPPKDIPPLQWRRQTRLIISGLPSL